MSENLARLAQKIDFSKTEDEFCNIKKEGESSSDTKSDEDNKDQSYQSSLWPWDSVRNKLRSALTEVSVLADVLNIAKEKRYMVCVLLLVCVQWIVILIWQTQRSTALGRADVSKVSQEKTPNVSESELHVW